LKGRRLEGITPLGPRLPQLFGLDARLRMPGGHGYWNRGDEIVYARLNRRGLCLQRAQAHPELLTAALLAAGLVDADMVLAHMQLRQAALANSGSSCGASTDGGFAFAGDSGCSDGGSDGGGDGGSSCGSSCGGGCGGGD